jgi:transposase
MAACGNVLPSAASTSIVPYRDNCVNRPQEDNRKLRRYKRRWKVERTNAWMKNFRRVTTRWNRNLTVY